MDGAKALLLGVVQELYEQNNHRVPAAKRVRDATGLDLDEAKELLRECKPLLKKIKASSMPADPPQELEACLIPTAVMSQQVGLMSWALSDQMRSVGLMMMPIFSHHRGKLCIDERAILEKIFTAGNHNCDWSYHVLFKEKTDARDLRPMVYSGKFIFASPLDLQQ